MSDDEKEEILWKILFGNQSNLNEQKTKKEKTYQENEYKQDKTYYIVEEVKDEDENDKEDNSSNSEDKNDRHYFLKKAFNSIFRLISVEQFFIRNEREPNFCDKFFDKYVSEIEDSIDDIKFQKGKKK